MPIYDCLIVDAINFCYRLFRTQQEEPVELSKKLIYKNSVCNTIKSLESLQRKYLNSDTGKVYLLFDSYPARVDFQSAYMYAERKRIDENYKASRKKENKEFYQSINLVKYYYLINSPVFSTVQVDGLEADDLVKPLLASECKDKRSLFITTDLDWCRYLNFQTDWLPDLSQNPETVEDLSQKLDFKVSETSIILYKAFFGDASDNIPAIISNTEENKNQFKAILKEISYPDDIFQFVRDADNLKRYPMLDAIISAERKKLGTETRLQINLYLASSLPCSTTLLKENIVSGENKETLLRSVQEALGLVESKKFVFGNIKRPRK